MSAITTTESLHQGPRPDAPLDIKSVHQRGFKWAMTLLFFLICLFTVLAVISVFGTGWIGLWAALLLAPLVGFRMTQLYRWLTRKPRLRHTLDPGNVACPRCGSLQTDLLDQVTDDSVRLRRVCFRCDHDWDV